jgi:hypothetical protein
MMIRLIVLFMLTNLVFCGPVSYAICQTACNTGAMTCYAIVGITYGVGVAPACSLAQGKCMAACTPLLIAPTP